MDGNLMIFNGSKFLSEYEDFLLDVLVLAYPLGNVSGSHGRLAYSWLVVTGCFIFIFPYIGNFIIPIDVHIFQRGGPTTNQIGSPIFYVPWNSWSIPSLSMIAISYHYPDETIVPWCHIKFFAWCNPKWPALSIIQTILSPLTTTTYIYIYVYIYIYIYIYIYMYNIYVYIYIHTCIYTRSQV